MSPGDEFGLFGGSSQSEARNTPEAHLFDHGQAVGFEDVLVGVVADLRPGFGPGQSRGLDHCAKTSFDARIDAFSEGRDTEAWLAHLWDRSQEVAEAHGFTLPDLDQFRAEGRFDIPDAEEARIALAGFVADPEAVPLATETGRITLANAAIGALKLPSCPAHPTWIEPKECLTSAGPGELHLISGQPDTRLHSQNDRGQEALADKIEGREAAYFHPETARALGLAAGDVARLYNGRGACLAGVRLDDGLRRDCVFLPTGAWFDPQRGRGAPLEVHGNPNVLTSDHGCSELSQGNMAHTCLIRAEKWTGALPDLSIAAPPEFTS